MQAPGTTLQERYRILRVIDEGPTVITFEALDTRFGTTVVVKELAAGAPEEQVACFERECRVLNALAHPALPFVFDTFDEDSSRFLVGRMIASDPLDRVVAAKGGSLSLGAALDIVDRVLDALDFLHTRKPPLVYANISATSVRVTSQESVLLTDFRWLVEAGHTTPGWTEPYAAPEQVRGEPVEARTDLYAAGALLYLLLTGHPPTGAAERLESGPTALTPVEELSPIIPAEIADAVHMALAMRPEDRPSSAADLRALLSAARGQLRTDRVSASAATAVLDNSESPSDRIARWLDGESPRTTVICRTCGAANEPTRTFCPHCGSLLRSDGRAHAALGHDGLSTVADAAPAREGPTEPVLPPEAGRVRLLVVEGEQPGTIFAVRIPETLIGRGEGDLQFPDDPFMSGAHARVIYRSGHFFVQDINSRNGTFVRVRGETPLRNGDMFLVGSQLLRVEYGARPDQGQLRVIFHDGATGERFPLRGRRTLIGRHDADVSFPADASLAEGHAVVECRDGGLVLLDGGSRNGTFLRVQTEAALHDGDLVIVGQHIFRFENDVEVGLA